MPFTFVFNGGFFDLEQLFRQLTGFATATTSGGLEVSGRLLTIQSVKLRPASRQRAAEAQGAPKQTLTGTITATAYVLPASQGLTGGATPRLTGRRAAPAIRPPAPRSSPTAPAIARVTP